MLAIKFCATIRGKTAISSNNLEVTITIFPLQYKKCLLYLVKVMVKQIFDINSKNIARS